MKKNVIFALQFYNFEPIEIMLYRDPSLCALLIHINFDFFGKVTIRETISLATASTNSTSSSNRRIDLDVRRIVL